MKKAFFAVILICIGGLVFLSITVLHQDESSPVTVDPYARSSPLPYRGVSWVAGDSIIEEHVETLKEHHVNWIAQTPFGWQRHYSSPEVMLNRGNRVYWGERDKGLIQTTLLAKKHGIKTLLKPHIWLMDRTDGKWLGDINMDSEKQWQEWFTNYRTFILHYARLAEEHQMEALCIGTELHTPAVTHEKEWRDLIREIRQVYRGQLTYAANWYKEYEEIRFWDALDFIGIQAYFPLSKNEYPSLEELNKGWSRHMGQMEKVQRKFKKPIVFTEAGYKSTPDAAIEPWQWPDRQAREMAQSEETQANGYEALFQTFWPKPYFAGLFLWKWYPRIREGRRDRYGFTPQHKAAEKVMARWYQRASAAE